jgi:hypothetical protein
MENQSRQPIDWQRSERYFGIVIAVVEVTL